MYLRYGADAVSCCCPSTGVPPTTAVIDEASTVDDTGVPTPTATAGTASVDAVIDDASTIDDTGIPAPTAVVGTASVDAVIDDAFILMPLSQLQQ